MTKAEILTDLGALEELLKDYHTFEHLFSPDTGTQTFARINMLMGKIRLMLEASDIKEAIYSEGVPIKTDKAVFVKVRPCGKEYGNKTYLGILLGDMACGTSLSIEDNKIKVSWATYNPAIFIPGLKKIVFGYESWWSKIDDPDQLKDIRDDAIDKTWYVQMFKNILGVQDEKGD
jgi:hypothetical protein